MHSNQEQPHIQLATMSRWYVVSRALHAVAKLGIANHMSLKPIDIDELAERTGTIPELLDRVLKFLSAYGLFNCDETGYSLTSLSMPLRDDDPHSVRDVLCMVDDSWWQSFAHLDTSLKTGNSAFSHQHGDSFLVFLVNTQRNKQILIEAWQDYPPLMMRQLPKPIIFRNFLR
ncbi:methyltransferase family protein [Legionella tunisiensis]|uniref:methyltransferase family protein n=1 Tax=Legionella tunisiensis TaxID=1034944 RepID=UPI0002DB4E53|nr:hypothetical protein [Legionella tunisiensis]